MKVIGGGTARIEYNKLPNSCAIPRSKRQPDEDWDQGDTSNIKEERSESNHVFIIPDGIYRSDDLLKNVPRSRPI